VRFEGVIEAMPAGSMYGEWVVAGQAISVTQSTEIEGTLAVGAYVKVKAERQADGSLVAIKIKVEAPEGDEKTEVEFQAIIKSLPEGGLIGEWVVGNHTLTVDVNTEIEGTPQVGLMVEVKAERQADGSLLALEIKILRAPGCEREVEFKGVIKELPAGTLTGFWLIGCCHQVEVNVNTVIEGTPEVGAFVEVKALHRCDGTFLALEIKVITPQEAGKQFRFHGEVEAMPADGFIGIWRIEGREVEVDADTIIDESRGPVAVGVKVEVRAMQRSGNIPLALRIRVREQVQAGQPELPVTVQGIIESLPAEGFIGQWIVAGQSISVTEMTAIHGLTTTVGLWAKAKGSMVNGALVADSVVVNESSHRQQVIHFTAVIEALPESDDYLGEWLIGGRQVTVTASTAISGTPEVGLLAEVEALRQEEGSQLLALRIEIKAPEGEAVQSSSQEISSPAPFRRVQQLLRWLLTFPTRPFIQ